MATKSYGDHPEGDRRSLREIEEAGVGGKNAPISAKAQLANTRKARQMKAKEKKRIQRIKRSPNRSGKLTD